MYQNFLFINKVVKTLLLPIWNFRQNVNPGKILKLFFM